MNPRRADVLVGALVVAVLAVGGALTWDAYRQQRAVDEMSSMMDTSMGAVHGTNPLWYVVATLLVAGVVGGFYLTVRDDLSVAGAPARASTGAQSRSEVGTDGLPTPDDSLTPEDSPTPDGSTTRGSRPGDAINPEEQPRTRVLDLLPADERRILEPVLSSPGVTQIELRDRSDFSKSKVSQTVSALEKRGLLYRERQGRTYRVYPSEDLARNQEH